MHLDEEPTSTMTFSESPTNGEYNCAQLTERKDTFPDEAAALAKVVLQHPGGPYISTPCGPSIPSLVKDCQ